MPLLDSNPDDQVRRMIASKATGGPPICAKKRPLTPKCGSRRSAAYACGYLEPGREDTQMKSSPQEMPTACRRLITCKEGLKHLRVGRTKAYELINAGKIIAYKQGHQTMIDADSVSNQTRLVVILGSDLPLYPGGVIVLNPQLRVVLFYEFFDHLAALRSLLLIRVEGRNFLICDLFRIVIEIAR
jgi:Helix-turn-helix domain